MHLASSRHGPPTYLGMSDVLYSKQREMYILHRRHRPQSACRGCSRPRLGQASLRKRPWSLTPPPQRAGASRFSHDRRSQTSHDIRESQGGALVASLSSVREEKSHRLHPRGAYDARANACIDTSWERLPSFSDWGKQPIRRGSSSAGERGMGSPLRIAAHRVLGLAQKKKKKKVA